MVAGVPLRQAVGFLAMVIGMFMAILDIQIVSASLTEIQAGIGATRDEISWVQTSYLIAEVIMIPLSGWLAHVFSTRWLFTASAVTFTIASAACAFTWNLESMIAFRACQGFLGGAMIPSVFATAYALFPRDRQAGVTVIIGLVATMAPTLGPTLGGWITDTFSWHWLFLINVFPGVVVASCVAWLVRVDRPNLNLLKGFDLPGILLVAVFLGCLQYVLEEGARDDWFESRNIIIGTIICAIGALGFFWRELTVRNPVVDLRAFTNANFAMGCLYSFIIGVGLYGSVYVLPLFLGSVRGYNALEIGIIVMVTGLFQLVSAPIAGRLSKILDLRAMLAFGLTFFALGLYLNSKLTAEWGYWEMFLPQAVRGFSLMFLFIPVNTLALGTLPPDMLKGGSGLYNLMRNLGGAIGLAVINTELSSRYDLHILHLAENITAARATVTGALDGMAQHLAPMLGSDAPLAALSVLARLAQREATVLSFADVLMMMSSVFLSGLLLMPFLRKVIPAAGAGESH